MLDLNPVAGLKWVTHEETETRYEIRPLSAKEHDQLRKDSKDKKNEFSVIVFGSKAAKRIINDWEGVGDLKRENGKLVKDENGKPILIPAECEDLAKLRFGERFAYGVVPWLIEKAMELDQEIEATKEDAKNG